MEKGQDWVITAEVVTKPESKIGRLQNLEVSVDVEKKLLTLTLKNVSNANTTTWLNWFIKEGAAENGDTVCPRLRWFYRQC